MPDADLVLTNSRIYTVPAGTDGPAVAKIDGGQWSAIRSIFFASR
jgi:hypothetical protein